ncbi:sialin-like [Tubulanus polymorphus]|uniref:sialin-like n=1 Tax=Tubulanus polymorphus TaxID=672921 RepID=UPI003DA374FA
MVNENPGYKWIGSCRLALALAVSFGFFSLAAVRATISVAIVCAVNHTAVKQLSEGNWTVHDDEDTVKCSSNLSFGYKSNYQEGSFIWLKETQGLILSSIYWGYVVTSLPAGIIASKYGGRIPFGTTTAVSAVATLLIPIASTVSPYLVIALRFIIGLCQGFAFPTGTALWAAWAPPLERTRLAIISFAGNQMGSVVTQMVSGVLCAYFGWPSIFYVFGGISCVCCICWFIIVYDSPEKHPRISAAEKKYIQDSLAGQMEKKNELIFRDVPWSKAVKTGAVWAIFIGFFSLGWLTLTFLLSVPSYINDVLKLDIKSNGVFSSLTIAMMWLFLILSGFISDYLIRKFPLKITWVRKVFYCVGMTFSAILIFILGFLDCSHVVAALILLITGLAMLGCSYSVTYSCTIDIAPKYAGLLMGIASTLFSLAGVLGSVIVGIITKNQTRAEWQVFFYTCTGIGLFGALIYLIFGSGEVQAWAKYDKSDDIACEIRASTTDVFGNENVAYNKDTD